MLGCKKQINTYKEVAFGCVHIVHFVLDKNFIATLLDRIKSEPKGEVVGRKIDVKK